MPKHKLLDFILKKKHEVEVVIDSIVEEDDKAVFIGEGTEDEYHDQVIADKGLAGIFGIERGGNNAP